MRDNTPVRIISAIALFPFLLSAVYAQRSVPSSGYRNWQIYGGGSENLRYSNLDQINRDNVDKLQIAWTYDTGDAFDGSEMQCNPIVVDGVLFASLPWYDLPEVREATDRFWACVAQNLRERGFKQVPEKLDRQLPFDQQWTSGRLLFSQACGYDILLYIRA